MESRPPLPPFSLETATQKVRLAEDGWNSRDPERVALVYTPDSEWRNRVEFPRGREQIIEFLRACEEIPGLTTGAGKIPLFSPRRRPR